MKRIRKWIAAARPRTLFLAAATVVLASGMAWQAGTFRTDVFLRAFLLALSIQILANFANDLGDYQKGTDTTGQRQGPERALQGGSLSPEQMIKAIILFIGITIGIGVALVTGVAKTIGSVAVAGFLVIGACCILAALFYTMGKHAYGYRGWGDLFAFLFFGPVPVIGTYFLHIGTLDFRPVLPAIGLGIISTLILNINNMRDIENDKASGKITIASRIGLQNAKKYHALLTVISFLCFLGYLCLYVSTPRYRYLPLLLFYIPFKILIDIQPKSGKVLDPYLKRTAIFGFLLSVVFSLCINL